jgi:ABC-type multidrug transport system fused ATPase/permease subunit
MTHRASHERQKGSGSVARALLWRSRWALAAGLLLLAVSNAAALFLPLSSKYLIDEVVAKKRLDLLVLIAALAAVATAIQAVAAFGIARLVSVTGQRVITDLKLALFRHVLRLPIRYFDRRTTGELVSRVMNDAEGVRNLIGTGMVEMAGSLMAAGLGLATLFLLDSRLTAVMLLTLVVFTTVMGRFFTRSRPLFRRRGELSAEVTGHLGEVLGGMRVVKAFGGSKREERVFARGVHRLLRNAVETITAVAGAQAVVAILFGLVGIVIMVMGGAAIVDGTMTLGSFVTYVLFTGMVASALVPVAATATQLGEAFAGLDRIGQVLMEPREGQGGARPVQPERVDGTIDVLDVSFEYEAGRPVLHHVTCHLAAGATTALVGRSGAGKTTLANLVLSFGEPTSGRILIDGVDLATLSLAAYRSHVGFVPQDSFLFDGTILENIRYGRRGASAEDARHVARVAHVEEFVASLPAGYDTLIGERGVRLSGGQRQRIAIARALLADPTVLVLDEATASVDSEAEAMIQDALRALRRGRTTLVIAHRLSTVQSADQILVLDRGSIVERGTHGQLLREAGHYRRLYEGQHRFDRNRFINPGEDFTPAPVPLAAIPCAPPPSSI